MKLGIYRLVLYVIHVYNLKVVVLIVFEIWRVVIEVRIVEVEDILGIDVFKYKLI